MKPWLRKGAIYLATLLSSAGLNIIAPFYSEAAERQGIHPWLIGVIYSVCPVAAFICSWFLPKYLERIGRTTVLCSGLIIIGLSNITLVFLPDSTFKLAILLSFISRITEGLGSACCMVTCNTTLTSDYPEDISRIVATIEIMSGIGLSAGPAIGSVIYKYSGFKMTCLSIGLAMLIYAPILLLIIGRSRKYQKTSEIISITTVLKKPVHPI
jgi:MFS family permease